MTVISGPILWAGSSSAQEPAPPPETPVTWQDIEGLTKQVEDSTTIEGLKDNVSTLKAALRKVKPPWSKPEEEAERTAKTAELRTALRLNMAEACIQKDAADAAKNADDAKVSADKAREASNRSQRAWQGLHELNLTYPSEEAAARKYEEDAKVCAGQATWILLQKRRAVDSLCGPNEDGRPRSGCLVFGLITASLSYVRPLDSGAFGGKSSDQLVSVAMPFGAVRFVPLPTSAPSWAVDIGFYSAFLTSTLARAVSATAKTSCSRSGGDFEAKLPCDANAAIKPYGAFYVGLLTLGKANLSYISVGPSIGWAQVGSNTTLRPYWGITLSTLTINGSL